MSVAEQQEPVVVPPVPGGIERARRPTGPVLGLVVVVVCLLVGQTATLLVLFPLLGVPPGAVRRPMGISAQLATLFSFLGASALLALWILLKERRPFGSVGFFPARRIGARLVLGALAGLVALSLPVGVNILSGQFDVGESARVAPALLALVGFAAQASTEEVLTRGYLLQLAHRKWGLAVAIPFQGVVFTALHGVNSDVSVIALVNIFLIAVVFAFWALTEGGLWGVCAFHAVWNWCQGNVYGIHVSGMDITATVLNVHGAPGSAALLTGGGFGIEGSLLTTAVLLVAAVLAFLVHRRRA